MKILQHLLKPGSWLRRRLARAGNLWVQEVDGVRNLKVNVCPLLWWCSWVVFVFGILLGMAVLYFMGLYAAIYSDGVLGQLGLYRAWKVAFAWFFVVTLVVAIAACMLLLSIGLSLLVDWWRDCKWYTKPMRPRKPKEPGVLTTLLRAVKDRTCVTLTVEEKP